MAASGERKADAASVGWGLAFPGELRGQLAAMIADERPVRAAVRAGWAGLDELRLVTAALNGSVSGVRGGRTAGAGGATIDGAGPGAEAGRAAGTGRAAADAGLADLAAGLIPEASAAAIIMERVRAAPAALDRAGEETRDGGEGSPSVLRERVPGLGGGAGVAAGDRVEAGAAPVSLSLVEVVEVARARADVGGVIEVMPDGFAAGEVQGAGSAPARTEAESGDAAVLDGGIAPVLAGRMLQANVEAALRGRARLAALPTNEVSAVEGGLVPGSAFSSGGGRGAMAGPGGAAEDGRQAGLDTGSAPQPPERGDSGMGGGGSGTVMMDGRLVGLWLSDRMASDAARPGAGTTFFDPRQAPAWTPSGAI